MKEQETYMQRTTTRGQTAPQTTPDKTPEEKYREYLEIPDLQKEVSRKKEGIKTGYYFKGRRRTEELILSPGLSLVCGKSSHGKTRLLQNLALRIVEDTAPDGVVLFFAFEEDYPEVIVQFANLQTNIPHLSQYESTDNTEVLRDYFQTGTLNKSPERTRQTALPRLEMFKEIQSSGRLRVYYSPDLRSGDLCNLLEYLSSTLPVKAVFLDYVQAIYKEGYRKERREELREICKELNKTSKDLDIPFILSAQLNRETPSPTSMSGDNIAESADITRYADTILCLWNSAFSNDVKDKDRYLESKDYKFLADRGFTLGEEGKLYCILTKNRGGTPYVDAVLDFVGETGSIPGNIGDLPGTTPEEAVQGEFEEFVQA